MSKPPLLLKFGSSVLRDVGSIGPVVSEIYRHTRRGRAVVAVVSAFVGRTDELLREAIGLNLTQHSERASWLSRGEAESVTALAEALRRVGVPVRAVGARELGLSATGPGDDATPHAVDASAWSNDLVPGGLVVVPGFVGRDDRGRPVTLGRGGSDITAIALGRSLNAEVRLVKDTGGVFEWDPNEPGPAPKKFSSLSYDDALALSERVIQPKAIRFARDTNVPFELVGLNADTGTRIDGLPTQLETTVREAPKPKRVALFGLGTVGVGVIDQLAKHPGRFKLVGALVRRPGVDRPGVPASLTVTSSVDELFATSPDLIVELIGGEQDAGDLVRRALLHAADVVTANKALLAAQGGDLHDLARSRGVHLLTSASVGGGTPVLERLALEHRRSPIVAIRAVLNGTSNFVLNELHAGRSLDDALGEARRQGFAEADASLDLSGLDAAQKLSVIAQQVIGVKLSTASVSRESLGPENAPEIGASPDPIRQVGVLEITGGHAFGRVGLVPVSEGPLRDLDGAENAVEFWLENGEYGSVTGIGAGRVPTAAAVVADLLDIQRGLPIDGTAHHADPRTNPHAQTEPEG